MRHVSLQRFSFQHAGLRNFFTFYDSMGKFFLACEGEIHGSNIPHKDDETRGGGGGGSLVSENAHEARDFSDAGSLWSKICDLYAEAIMRRVPRGIVVNSEHWWRHSSSMTHYPESISGSMT